MGDVEPKSINRGQLPGCANKSCPENRQEAKKECWDPLFGPETQGEQASEKEKCNNPEPGYLPDVSRAGVHFANLRFLSIQAALL